MLPRALAVLANVLVVAYAADAGLSLIEEAVRTLSGSTLLLGPRNLLAAAAFYTHVACFPILALTPRLPPSVFLPLVLTILWLNLGAVPVSTLVGSDVAASFALALLQVAIAGAALLGVRRLNGGRGWLFTSGTLDRPIFSVRHSMGFAAGSVFLILPAFVLYLLVYAAASLEVATRGFVSFDLTGVSLADRRYVRDDREIRLVGMVHIGESEAYRKLVSSFATESTVVLQEGVSDLEGLFDVPLSYEGAARALGLEQQEDLRSYLVGPEETELPRWPVVRHADLDASDFAPETVAWLRRIAGALDDDRPIRAMARLTIESSGRPEEAEIVLRDLFGRRNQHLLGEIDAALGDYRRVLVPWGALHLPAIEGAIVQQGFRQAGSRQRRLIRWLTIATALRAGG